jgi:hypothetical protein
MLQVAQGTTSSALLHLKTDDSLAIALVLDDLYVENEDGTAAKRGTFCGDSSS